MELFEDPDYPNSDRQIKNQNIFGLLSKNSAIFAEFYF